MAQVIPPAVKDAIRVEVLRVLQSKLDAIPPARRGATEFRPLEERDVAGLSKPFHQLLFPEGLLRAWEFERTFSTALGTSFEVTARRIGELRFSEARRGGRFEGIVSPTARSAIDDILRDTRRDGMKQPYSTLVSEVVNARVGAAGAAERVTVDLYVRDAGGSETFFEMKSPKPNKDQCVGTTEKLLILHAMRKQGPPEVRTFYAMAFNPYGDSRTDYDHNLAIKYLDFQEQVLIGREFWDFIGGDGTYDEVLSNYRDVGAQMKDTVVARFRL